MIKRRKNYKTTYVLQKRRPKGSNDVPCRPTDRPTSERTDCMMILRARLSGRLTDRRTDGLALIFCLFLFLGVFVLEEVSEHTERYD